MKYAYIGCRTTKQRNARGKGIKLFRIDGDGEWRFVQLVSGIENPSFLCASGDAKNLYAVHGDGDTLSAYTVADNGKLSALNTASVCGTNPVHVAVDPSGRWVYVACHRTGTLCVLARNEDGSLGECRNTLTLSDANEAFSHPHQVVLDRTGRYAIVPAQGLKEGPGKIATYRIDREVGTLLPADVFYARKNAEPRHCVLHPNNRFLYCVNEWDSTVTLLHFDEETGKLTPKQIVPALPDTWIRAGWSSAIDLDKDGGFLYTTDRNYNIVSQFEIDAFSGRIRLVGTFPTGGTQPRFMCVDRQSGHVFAANECSDTICEFEAEAALGAQSEPLRVIETESPVCILFLEKLSKQL